MHQGLGLMAQLMYKSIYNIMAFSLTSKIIRANLTTYSML